MSKTTLDTPVLAEKYDRLSERQFNNGLILIRKLNIEKADHVLDIGCGTGRLAIHIAKEVSFSGKVVGIDPLPNRINIALQNSKRNNLGHVSFYEGYSDDLSRFDDSSFDVVYMNGVFHWVANKEGTLSEIYRILRNGGKLGITTIAKELQNTTRLITDSVLARKPYAGNVPDDPTLEYNVTTDELKHLLDSRYKIKSLENINITSYYKRPEEALDFMASSSFGNFLDYVPAYLRQQALAEIAAELNKLNTSQGIGLSAYTNFVVAEK